MKLFTKFLPFLALLAACAGEEGIEKDSGMAFFPLETGLYGLYEVEEIRYHATAPPEKLSYELKMQVADSIPAGGNQYHYVIHRHRRRSGAEAWEPMESWSVRKDHRQVVVSEGNIPFVKMKFPVADEWRWDGNALNTLGSDEYVFRNTGQPWQSNGLAFDRTVTVEQEDNKDFVVSRDVRREVYAAGTGLVYKKIIQLKYCTDDACLGQQKVDHGIEMSMSIKEYGKR